MDEFRTIIGSEYVLETSEAIHDYNVSLIPVEKNIPGVILPNTHEDVVSIVDVANEYGISISPISRGKNWGYGTAQPPQDGTVIVDLGRLSEIKTVNEQLGYSVIQPGVTPQQLHRHLDENDIDLIVEPPGSGPDTSLVGNALERGIVAGRYHDRFGAVCSMQVVLPTGETIKTGFGTFDSVRDEHVYEYGVGPHLKGMFSQSNFGIVTEVGLWLAPKPAQLEAFFVQAEDPHHIRDLIAPLRTLYQREIVTAPIVVSNRNRALALATQCPDEYLGREIPENVLTDMAEEHGAAAWNVVGVIYGTPRTISGTKKEVEHQFTTQGFDVSFVSRRRFNLIKRLPSIARTIVSRIIGVDLEHQLPVLENILELFEGVPNESSLKSAYWRTGQTPPESKIDPAEDECGLFFVSPIVPLETSEIQEFLTIVQDTFDDHHLEFCINIDVISSRAAMCFIPILFDASNTAESNTATEIYERLHDRCLEEGFIPCRESIIKMSDIQDDSGYWNLSRTMKDVVDPNHILSPGRYESPPGKK